VAVNKMDAISPKREIRFNRESRRPRNMKLTSSTLLSAENWRPNYCADSVSLFLFTEYQISPIHTEPAPSPFTTKPSTFGVTLPYASARTGPRVFSVQNPPPAAAPTARRRDAAPACVESGTGNRHRNQPIGRAHHDRCRRSRVDARPQSNCVADRRTHGRATSLDIVCSIHRTRRSSLPYSASSAQPPPDRASQPPPVADDSRHLAVGVARSDRMGAFGRDCAATPRHLHSASHRSANASPPDAVIFSGGDTLIPRNYLTTYTCAPLPMVSILFAGRVTVAVVLAGMVIVKRCSLCFQSEMIVP